MRRRSIALSTVSALLILSCRDTPGRITSPEGTGLPDVRADRQGVSLGAVEVSVSPGSATIEAGATVQLTATTTPPTSSKFTWATSDQSVATVNQSGLVTGLGPGSATITASARGRSGSSIITVTAPPPPPPPAGSEGLLAAGDIASCTNDFDEATAKILDANLSGTVALLGDNAYEDGSVTDYANCYGPTWGRHFDRTMPSAGNHEYQTTGAAGYYAYFGSKAGDPSQGYYSYDLGEWHIIALNSNIARDAESAQLQWLRADLQANAKSCTLAYWHHPRFSSGRHGNDFTQSAFWDVLYQYNADVVLSGHDHNYERFAPQTPAGVADNARGIRAFVVGTGGRELRTLRKRIANSQVSNSTTFGVLSLILAPGSYTWRFLPVAGQTFTDSGSGGCH